MRLCPKYVYIFRTAQPLGSGVIYIIPLLCKLWALRFGIKEREFDCTQAEWDVWGNRAGNMRNSRMLREFKPDVGVAFPGNNGTHDMKVKLHAAGVPTFVGRYTTPERAAVKWQLPNWKAQWQ